MSKRISPKGNKKPETRRHIKVGIKKPINDGIFGVNVKEASFNPIISFNGDKRNFSLFFEHESLSKNVGYFKFKKLKALTGLDAWQVNRMLYTRAGLMAFNYGDEKHILPFVVSAEKGLTFYGLPRKVKPVPYAQNMRLLIDKDYEVGVDCVIWLDVIPFEPSYSPVSRQFYNTIINNQKAEILTRIKMSMIAHFEKIILRVENQATANKVRNALRSSLENGDPVAVVTEFFETNKDVFNGSQYVGGEFFSTLKDHQSLQDIYNGIATSGYGINKGERLVSGELSGISEQVDIIADLRRRMCKSFARDCRRILGWEGFEIEVAHIMQTEEILDKMNNNNFGNDDSKEGVEK